ncbi:MAG: DNA-formamidopyrimidine glycosylase family protein [Leptolyngbyaceae cyanobacterium bins.302]|nr:DNA-formamidopyrimidine glycosylase family protein [Leptolyngbyaceae cyanobacterium bins.302]
MPELPEVETVKRGLNQVTLHQTITGGDVLLDRTIAHPSSIQEFLTGLTGTAIAQWHRRGKYLLASLTPTPPHPPHPTTPPHPGHHPQNARH